MAGLTRTTQREWTFEDVAVFGEPQRLEPEVLDGPGQLEWLKCLVGREDDDANMHGWEGTDVISPRSLAAGRHSFSIEGDRHPVEDDQKAQHRVDQP